MIKLFKLICFIVICLFIISIFIGKKTMSHINYNDIISNAYYFTNSTSDVNRQFNNAENILIDDNTIDNISDLFEQSNYVLKVSIEEDPILYGDSGLINRVKIIDVLKGNDNKKIKIGNTINVYDLIMSWGETYIDYYGGMTPLNKNYQYVIFIKNAPFPNYKDTYIFSSIKYGHFVITIPDTNILLNYVQGSLHMKEIMKYDYVQINCDSISSKCDKDIEGYIKLKKQLLEILNK